MLIKYWTNLTACSCIFTARQRSCGKVMFSVVCVCLSTALEGVPCAHYLIVQGAIHPATPPDMRPSCKGPLSPVSDIWWPSLGTCSSLFTPPPPPPLLPMSGDNYWRTYRRRTYASYWNAFLFLHCLWNLSDWVLYPNLLGTLSSMFV